MKTPPRLEHAAERIGAAAAGTRPGLVRPLIVAVLAAVVVALVGPAAEAEEYALRFIPTQNLPSKPFRRAEGVMTINVVSANETHVTFQLRGAYPNTLYTIWTVYNVLSGPGGSPSFDFTRDQMISFYSKLEGHSVPSTDATKRAGFPPEGNGVSPTASLGAGFTSGMGPDPGATFATDHNGNAEFQGVLDFDLVNRAPVSNKDIIGQCTPVPGTKIVETESGKFSTVCVDPSSRLLRITTTWLRKFIGQVVAEGQDPAKACSNYDARFDPTSPRYQEKVANGANALLWQCVDPSNGMPRVHRFQFDHFRLANHPDDLTHGFIGGNGVDHWIDMVGRRVDLEPGTATLSGASTSSGRSRNGSRDDD